MACLSNQIEVKFEVDSRYSIVETIGNGAYGVVCSAVDNKTGCKVAIKKISKAFDVPAITKRTLRELKILKHFKHDNVIGIKEILRPPEDLSKFDDVYVVFDLMESDLHHIIHSKQTLSNEHVEYFLYQILRGLKYIHSANIIHRDLKPSNILVNHDCELKIGDFGMARSLLSSPNEQKRVMTEYVATRWYRAPELMLSLHQFSYGIDIWSVGCILAEMLGRTPIFPGSNYLNQLQLILSVVGLPSSKFLCEIASERVRNYINKLPQKEPVSFRKLYPDAPQNAIDLLSLMLKLDPRERCTAKQALEHQYVSRYHDIDDEPSCRPLICDFENLPLEKETLRSEIVKEIRSYHSKHPRPKLTPLATKFFAKEINVKDAGQVDHNVTNIDEPCTSTSIISVMPSIVKKAESRKRKQKCFRRDSKAKKPKDDNEKKSEEDSSLSVEDKKMLERWTNMQKTTTPFIHPIRKHMKELHDIQAQEVTIAQSESIDGQKSNTFDALSKPQLQFTNLVPAQKGGVVTLVKDSGDKVAISKSQKVSTVPFSSLDKPVVTCNKIPISQFVSKPLPQTETKISPIQSRGHDSTILVPMGAIPCYQIRGPFNPKGQVIILPNIKTAPLQVSQSQSQGIVIAPNTNIGASITIPSNSILVPQTGIKNVVPIVAKTNVSTTTPDTAKDALNVNKLVTVNSVMVSAANASIVNYQGGSQTTSQNTEIKSLETLPQGVENVCKNEDAVSPVCIVTPDGKLKAISPKDLPTSDINPLKNSGSSHWTNNDDEGLSFADTDVAASKDVSQEMKMKIQGELEPNDKSDKEQLSAEFRKLDPQERNIVELVGQLEAENETRSMGVRSSLGDESAHLERPNELTVTKPSSEDATSSTYRSPELEIPSISLSLMDDEYDGKDDDNDEDVNKFDDKSTRDVLLTTLLTPRTPKSGAYGYGLGLDLEELFNQTNPQEFWTGTRDTQSDERQMAMESAPLSSSLLNDWLGIKNLDTEAMEELQRELETNTSLLLFDT